MAITDPAAIKFSNERFRPSADRLARCYYRGNELNDAWTALGGTNDEKFALLINDIRKVANLYTNTWRFLFWSDRIYQSGSLAPLFPNDAGELLHDNNDGTAQDPNRPPLNGQDLTRLKRRMEEFTNWLARGTDADKHFVTDANINDVTNPLDYNYFDDFARLDGEGAKTPTANWGWIVAVERAGDLITEYEVTNASFLNHILKAAVNPQATV